MSLFFDQHLALQPQETVITTAWSNSELQPVLAVSTNKPRIVFVLEEGTLMPNFEIARGKTPTILKWHPVFPALAIGWDDGNFFSLTCTGVITLWNEDDRLSREEKVLHKSAITNITFSSDGTRMVTGDEVPPVLTL
jgi:hypothetical protein